MKPFLWFACLVSVLSLSACGGSEAKEGALAGNKTDVNEANFRAAVAQYLDKKGKQCLNPFPLPVDVDPRFYDMGTKKFVALEAAGVLQKTEVEVDEKTFVGKPTGKKITVHRYTLADSAKPFWQEQETAFLGKQNVLCWGKKSIDKVVKWEGPLFQQVNVIYTYQIDGLAEWAKHPAVQAEYPHIKPILDGIGTKENDQALKLNNLGWEALGLN